MSDAMSFPATVEEFMEQYKIVDCDHVYSNGMEMVPIFRMKQWFEHEANHNADSGKKVDTIPVEWINDHVAWLESMDADVGWSDARAIKVMLTKWKMEQENAGGCSADACPIKF